MARVVKSNLTVDDLNKWVGLNEFVVLDFETTGLSYTSGARIIDIGAYTVKDNMIETVFSQLVYPNQSIPDNITTLTGITNNMVKMQPTIREVMPSLIKYIGDKTVVCHNAKFDIETFLKPCYKDLYFEDLNVESLCTLEVARKFREGQKNDLGTVYKAVTGELMTNGHRATIDALATVKVAVYMREFIRLNYDNIVANW